MNSSKSKEEEDVGFSDRLPLNDLLLQILAFVGDRNYRFVGSVNHSFREAYATLFPYKETNLNVSSKALAELCMNDCAKKYDTFYKTTESLEEHMDYSELDGYDTAVGLLMTAAKYNFAVLKYLHSLPFDSKFKEEVWSCQKISASAAQAGHLHIVQWLHEQNIPSDSETCKAAAHNGHLEVLQWCHTNGFAWDSRTFFAAAEGGHWPVLNYLFDNGCPWDLSSCSKAAGKGHLEVLKWLRSKGCPWCPTTLMEAAGNGHLHVLQWAYHNGCPVDEFTFVDAYRNEQHEILEWALEEGIPIDQDFLELSDEDMYDNDDESETNDSGDDDSQVEGGTLGDGGIASPLENSNH